MKNNVEMSIFFLVNIPTGTIEKKYIFEHRFNLTHASTMQACYFTSLNFTRVENRNLSELVLKATII